jgi:transposase InsO family protein
VRFLRTGQGWLYLCAVRDGCNRRVIGWAIDEHLHTDPVNAALTMAVAMRGELAERVILRGRPRLPVHLGAARVVCS